MRVEIEATSASTGRTKTVVAVFNECELAVAIFEALTRQRRPEGMTWQQGWAELEGEYPATAEEMQRAANAAMQYFTAQVNLAGRAANDQVQ